MTDGTQKGLNIWKKKEGKLDACQAHCLEAEYGKHDSFASDCKKSKGFFKCCVYA